MVSPGRTTREGAFRFHQLSTRAFVFLTGVRFSDALSAGFGRSEADFRTGHDGTPVADGNPDVFAEEGAAFDAPGEPQGDVPR